MIIKLTWSEFDCAVKDLSTLISSHISDWTSYSIYGQPRGGLPLSVALSHTLNLPHGVWSENTPAEIAGKKVLWIDDVIESGETLLDVVCLAKKQHCTFSPICWVYKPGNVELIGKSPFNEIYQTLLYLKLASSEEWIVFPWENQTLKVIEEDCRAYAVGIGGSI
ncbi:MAG: hypothetical protein KGN01_07240 [Patescibacteria group bacterium]|nr:hypothetical protein [Patescibacteria group bacterium]